MNVFVFLWIFCRPKHFTHLSPLMCCATYFMTHHREKSACVNCSCLSVLFCSSGRLSWMFSRSRPFWGSRLTTRCLWPRTRQPGKQWWPSMQSPFPRSIWRGLFVGFFASTLSFPLSSRSRELSTILSLKVAGLLIILSNLCPIKKKYNNYH